MLGLNLEEPRALREERERGEAKGLERGRREEARSLIIRQLTRRFGVMAPERTTQIDRVSLGQLEDFGWVGGGMGRRMGHGVGGDGVIERSPVSAQLSSPT